MKKKMNRRQALESLVMGPLGVYLTAKFSGFNFIADVLGDDMLDESFLEHKLINFSLSGGASRYYWDLPLAPNGSDDYLEFTKCCITKYGSNIQGDGRYVTTKVGDFYMPSMWATNIPTPGGSTSMKSLANNMLNIRGLWLPQSGHTFCRHSMMIPTPGKSLLGIVADDSSLPIPAVGTGNDSSYFISQKGLKMIRTGGSDPLTSALRPFIDGSDNWSTERESVEQGIDLALDAMKAEAGTKHKFLPTTYVTRVNAKRLMKKEYGNLRDAYNSIKDKYKNLQSRAMHGSEFRVNGVEDRAVPGDGSKSFNVGRTGGSDDLFYNGNDLRQVFNSNSSISDMAEEVAVAEFMIKEGYTSAFSASFGRIRNLNMSGFVTENGNSRSTFTGNIGFDNHELGSHFALMYYTKFFKAFSSVMYEFTNQLKSASLNGETMFDKSVVTLTGDFNRSARFDGSGADHGNDGCVYTVLSGMIPKHTVIGNTTQYASTTNGRRGSWGVGAPMEELGNRKINIGNVASSICTFLDKESPTPNDATLVKKVNGKIYSNTDRPKNLIS